MNVKLFFLVMLSIASCKEKTYYLSEDKSGNKKIESECQVNPITGKKNGACVTYNLEGDTLSVAHFKNGKLHGKAISYFSDKKIQTVIEFKDGDIDGVTKEYYSNGQLAFEVLYKNNKLKNIIQVNDSMGNPLDYGYIDDGYGYVRRFYPDGIVEAEGNYKNGSRFGKWYKYTTNEILIDSVTYGNEPRIDFFGY